MSDRYENHTQLMFWDEENDPNHLKDNAGEHASSEDVALVIGALRSGRVFECWRGYAGCRICGERLGTTDRTDGTFVWPEKAEHYVSEHGVWSPEIQAFADHLKGSTR